MANATGTRDTRARDRKAMAVGGLALAAAFFVLLNLFASATFRNLQIDLTEGGLYTLSDGTRDVLAHLQEPVRLRLFVSPKLLRANPALSSFSSRIQEMLERYVALSGGKLDLEIINPEPFTPAEDRAIGFGLQGVPLDESGDRVYFGLAGTNTTDDSDVIAFFTPQREPFLEYDLTRLVNNLANPKKRVIGLITSTAMEADPVSQYKPWRVVEQMRQLFELRSIIEPEKIDKGLDVLMIVHPIAQSAEMQYAIDQYVLGGGKALIFVDPFSEEASRSNAAQRLPADSGSDFDKLFKSWGIAFDAKTFVGDRRNAQRVGTEAEGGGGQVIVDYLPWQSVRRDRLSPTDVVTGELEILNFQSAGAIAAAAGAAVTIEPLATTTAETMLIETAKIRTRPDPAALLKDFKSDNKVRVLAARVGGKLKSAFPDGPPKTADDKKPDDAKPGVAKPESPAHLAESAGPVNLIVVGDVDFLADRSWLQVQEFFGRQIAMPHANNGDFVINALDNLAGTAGLISLRSRGTSSRPFELVSEIRRDAELRYSATEKALQGRLEETEKKLKEMQTTQRGQGAAILSPEQKATIDNFRKDMVATRGELRQVQAALRSDIDSLAGWLKVLNIGAMPVVVLVVAIVLALGRAARRKHHLRGA